MVSYYDHSAGIVPRPTILMDKGTNDAHDNPTLMLDKAGYVWVFASSHGTARPSYIFKSAEPYTIDAFETIAESNFSYPQPWYLEGNGFLFPHTKYINGRRILHWMTSDDGVRWNQPHPLAGIAKGHYQISWICGDRLGTAFNYHPEPGGLNYRTNLYYLETDDFGKNWRNIRGEIVDTPLEEVENGALVHDYASEGLLVYLKDLNFDARGNPIILYITSRGYESGPKNNPRRWTTAHWTAKEWDIRGEIESDSNYDTGCLHVESDGVWRIIAPTGTGPQPYNPGGEMEMWISDDQGDTWSKKRQLTFNSPYNHTYARRPVNAHPDFYAFWADGHARTPSDSRLYFCNRSGTRVMRLPSVMTEEFAIPELISN